MTLIQILLISFFFLAIIRVVARFYAKDLNLISALFWSLLWAVGLIIVLIPDSTFYFANLLGVGRGVDLVIYLSLALLFFLMFKIMVELKKINRKIIDLARKDALGQEKNIK